MREMASAHRHGWTRGRFLRAAFAGSAMAAGGVALAAGGADDASLAAPSEDTDADILNLFLLLEDVQEAFYRQARASGRLKGDLLIFAATVGPQEAEHAEFLAKRLGSRARRRPDSAFHDLFDTPERFRDAAIELEEAAIATYVGQGANLTREALAAAATLVSVEARQAAWIRDLARTSPAPRVADPARSPDAVLADLRRRGFLT
jgi:truncated hemoglobin YjbI